MSRWKDTLLPAASSIKAAIETLSKTNLQIVLVVDGDLHLLGTVTDGDIRRGILAGIPLEAEVERIMNTSPVTASEKKDRESILRMMRQKSLRQIPVLNEKGRVVGLEVLIDLITRQERDNLVVLMAGGLGSRLGSLTSDTPKPLLKVGNKPILETILESFIEHGFSQFFLAVNYQAEKLVDHFGDGSKWGAKIRFLHETKRLGTAGALGLLPEHPNQPIIVMNGDLLTKVNFKHLLDYHQDHKAMATMCVREYDYEVPYGVVNVKDHSITSIDEKPRHSFFVNAGIYVLSPEALDYIEKDSFFDMTTLFERLLADRQATAAFPIREYWLDIGQPDDFYKANGDFHHHFSSNS